MMCSGDVHGHSDVPYPGRGGQVRGLPLQRGLQPAERAPGGAAGLRAPGARASARARAPARTLYQHHAITTNGRRVYHHRSF